MATASGASSEAREALRGAYAPARRAGARLRVISDVDDTPKMCLENATSTGLAMGARGFGPLRAVLVGGVSRRVTAAHCPVVVLPRGVSAAPLEALAEARRTRRAR